MVSSRNGERPATDRTVGRARKFAGTGNAATSKPIANNSQPVPATAMAHAFLRALREWLARHYPASTSQQIAIPTGRVSDDELARVLRAIFGAKQ